MYQTQALTESIFQHACAMNFLQAQKPAARGARILVKTYTFSCSEAQEVRGLMWTLKSR